MPQQTNEQSTTTDQHVADDTRHVSEPVHLIKRQQAWDSLAVKQWDVLVVGGGITGAGVAREAARCGLSVALVEQQDFSWGTSSRSSKMVHGGLRYLAMGDKALTEHSLLERERMLGEAPGLVERMGYYFLLKKSWFPWRLAMAIILGIYDRIAGIDDHRHIDKKTLSGLFKGVNTEAQKGASYYTDAVTDDCRLVQRVLQEAEKDSALLLNYCKVEAANLEGSDSNTVNVVTIKDVITGERQDIRAKVVVNSTGAWADNLRGERIDERRIRPLKGSHLVLRSGVIPVESALTCSHPDDGRSVFIFPWEGLTVIGTTDLDYDKNIDDEAFVSNEETDYLLRLANFFFPAAKLTREHVMSSWSGVRPVIASEKNFSKPTENASDAPAPSKERRDHAVWDDQSLITVSGGKLTTFRLMAQDVMVKTAPYLSGFDYVKTSEPVFTPCTDSSLEISHLRLLGRFGYRLPEFLELSRPEELAVIENTDYCLAECRWALEQEQVAHLDDLLLRRTRLGLILENGAETLWPSLKTMCQDVLLWDDNVWAEELTRFQKIWTKNYSVPNLLNVDKNKPEVTHNDELSNNKGASSTAATVSVAE